MLYSALLANKNYVIGTKIMSSRENQISSASCTEKSDRCVSMQRRLLLLESNKVISLHDVIVLVLALDEHFLNGVILIICD